MNRAEAGKLAQQIRLDDPQIRIVGFSIYGNTTDAVECVDTRTGYPFIIRGWDDWNERKRAADQ
jgi:hypothetical protein